MNLNTYSNGAKIYMHNICSMRKKLITTFREIQKKSFGTKSSQKLLPVTGNKECCFR